MLRAGWAVLTWSCSSPCIQLRVAWGLGSAGTSETVGLPLFVIDHFRLLHGMDSKFQEGETEVATTLKT